MADIAAGDVTYTVTKQRKEESGNKVNSVTITFGNGSLTYPANGIPLTKASMGCPNAIIAGHLLQANSGDGIIYKYDQVNNKIRMFRQAGHNHTLFLNNADVADSAGARVNAGTNLLGANTGSDISIAGVADTTGAGGIVTNAAGNLIELVSGSTAVVAATLYMDVIGW